MIDKRLLECDSKAKIEENFNRILKMIDSAAQPAGAETDPAESKEN